MLMIKNKALRIVMFLFLFAFIRDEMTPVGLWEINSAFEIRFTDQSTTLLTLALSSLALVAVARFFLGPLRDWVRDSVVQSSIWGLAQGTVIAFLPSLIRHHSGPHAGALWAVAALAYLGNLLEEVLFRGYLQKYLNDRQLGRTTVILLSGSIFALFHLHLAYLVGWPVLAFTLVEGLICAELRERQGLLAAVIAHGTGIFLFASGFA